MKHKSYSKSNDLVIKEIVSLFVERVGDGIYHITKNKQGDYHKFITSEELVKELNSKSRTAVAVQKGDGIVLHSKYLDDLDKEIMYKTAKRERFQLDLAGSLG